MTLGQPTTASPFLGAFAPSERCPHGSGGAQGNAQDSYSTPLSPSTVTVARIDARDYLFDAMLRLAEGGDPAKLTPCEWQRRYAAEFAERRRFVAASVRLQASR